MTDASSTAGLLFLLFAVPFKKCPSSIALYYLFILNHGAYKCSSGAFMKRQQQQQQQNVKLTMFRQDPETQDALRGMQRCERSFELRLKITEPR
jgi:hypothetical protein